MKRLHFFNPFTKIPGALLRRLSRAQAGCKIFSHLVIIYPSQGPGELGLGNYVYQLERLFLCDLKCKILYMVTYCILIYLFFMLFVQLKQDDMYHKVSIYTGVRICKVK